MTYPDLHSGRVVCVCVCVCVCRCGRERERKKKIRREGDKGFVEKCLGNEEMQYGAGSSWHTHYSIN